MNFYLFLVDTSDVMISNPILIERPFAINGEKAVVARPLDKIYAIITS